MALLPEAKAQYVDRPELAETFVDSIRLTTFDGQALRMEFCVTRLDEPKQSSQPTGKRYPACRLVMPPETVVELYNRLGGLIAAMEKRGVVKRGAPNTPPKTPPKANA